MLANGGEAAATRAAADALPCDERDALIEFLKSLQVVAPGTPAVVVDELDRDCGGTVSYFRTT